MRWAELRDKRVAVWGFGREGRAVRIEHVEQRDTRAFLRHAQRAGPADAERAASHDAGLVFEPVHCLTSQVARRSASHGIRNTSNASAGIVCSTSAIANTPRPSAGL